MHHEIVDRHGDEVDADGVVHAGFDRDLDLGADAVGGGDQHRILEARALEIEQSAEAADLGVGAGPRRRLHQRLDQLHHAVAGIDIDAGLRIGEALFAHGLCLRWNRNVCNGSIADILSRLGGRSLSIPNLITLARILLVPVVVWAIATGHIDLAFMLFLAAAVSDAVDGFLAKRFGMKTELGAYLDPLADKVLIVSIYVTLGITGVIPLWIVILVVSRDFMIVGAIILSWVIGRPVAIRPHIVSKVNTGAQIVFAGLVLASRGFGFDAEPVLTLVMALVAVLTLLSVGLYLAEWVRHMNSTEAGA